VGMHRQGFDLQLTQYDDRGWRATLLHDRDGTQPDRRDRHGLGARAVARGAAGGAAWEVYDRPARMARRRASHDPRSGSTSREM
jgi:hypothetical protein